MPVNLSALAGAGQQFFDNNGVPLTGGKLFSYAAGTTTPQATYTSATGLTAHSNPIILDAAGRVPSGEIWLTAGSNYKFVLNTSSDVLIATWDNITGINGTGITSNAVNVAYDPAGTGAVATTVQAKLRETVSIKDFGAVGDGVADDTVAIQNAELNVPVYASPGTYLSTSIATPADLVGTQYGYGQIKTADNNLSAPKFAIATSAPTSTGNPSSITTAFNGDLSKSLNPTAMYISGVNSLGTPATGYKYTPELTTYFTYLRNTSGWNEKLDVNDGRTAATVFRTRIEQSGQGDAMCYNGSVNVSGTKAGSTSFLANPAGALFAGEVATSTDGTYCNPAEWNCQDNGYDVAAIGLVNNFFRTNDTGAKNAVWIGYRVQSLGTKPINSFLSFSGTANNGLDLVTGNFGTNQSAISLKAQQRIYFNNTATPTGGSGIAWVTNNYSSDYIQYSVGIDTGLQFVVGGVQSFTVRSDAAVLNNANGLSFKNTGVLRFDGTNQALTGTSTALFTATNKPGTTTGANPDKWLKIIISGAEYFIPCWVS